MIIKHTRKGSTLVEVVLFVSFFAFTAAMIIQILIGVHEQRIRQESIAEVNDMGAELLQVLSQNLRHAERILDPGIGNTGDFLALRMADESDSPKVLGTQSGVLYLGIYDDAYALSKSGSVAITNLVIKNTSASSERQSVNITFDINAKVPFQQLPTYSKSFSVLIALYPDELEATHSCSCSAPSCSSGMYEWEYCDGSCQVGAQIFEC